MMTPNSALPIRAASRSSSTASSRTSSASPRTDLGRREPMKEPAREAMTVINKLMMKKGS